jgi:hypothetical protein
VSRPPRRRARKPLPADPYEEIYAVVAQGLELMTPATKAKPKPVRKALSAFATGCVVPLTLAGALLAMILSYRHAPKPQPPPAPSLRWSAAGDLQDCSPFASLDGRRLLAFNARGHRAAEGAGARASDQQTELDVELEAIAAGPPGQRLPEGLRAGPFQVDDATGRVAIALPGETQSYTLLEPMPLGADGCVLVFGDLAAADLTKSWFGAPAVEPTPDEPAAER